VTFRDRITVTSLRLRALAWFPRWGLSSVHWVGRGVYRFARTSPAGAVGASIVLLMLVLAIFGPLLQPFGPLEPHYDALFRGPFDGKFLLGTDFLGRDQLSRLIAGTRPALFVSFFSVLIGGVIGGLFGLVSGYVGGRFDLIFQRVMDGLLAMPTLILALALVAILGRGDVNVGIAIAVIVVPMANRLVRAVTLASKEEMYVEAAKALGASGSRIMFRHVGPNALSPLLVVITNQISHAIIIAAALSFLGVTSSPPAPRWGLMLSEGIKGYAAQAPWLVIGPALFIFAAIFAFTLLGDAARDHLDPRMR